MRCFLNRLVAAAIPLVLVLALASTAVAGGVDRDWKTFPAIVELNTDADVYALGDIHADCDRLVQLLAGAKLIAGMPANPQGVHWSGGKSVLVITGDFIDKYTQGMQVISVLRAIQVQAEAAGGRVVITLGNHEAEFLASEGNSRKKFAETVEALKANGIELADVMAGRDAQGVGSWLRTLPAGAKVNDWFFCHAGNIGGRSLSVLKAELESQIGRVGFGAPILSDPNSMLEARMHPRPWWTAVTAAELKLADSNANASHTAVAVTPTMSNEQKLRTVVEALGCRHLVIGHQPGKIEFGDGTQRPAGEILGKFNGLFYMIDTGMSRGVDSGHAALLHIHSHHHSGMETVTVVDSEGKSRNAVTLK